MMTKVVVTWMMAAMALFLPLLVSGSGYSYVDGVNPRTFAKGDRLKIRSLVATSTHTLSEFDLYETDNKKKDDMLFPVCRPRGQVSGQT